GSHAALDDVDEEPRRERQPAGGGTSARPPGEDRARQGSGHHRRAVRRGKGSHQWLHADPGTRSVARGRAGEGLPDARRRRRRRSETSREHVSLARTPRRRIVMSEFIYLYRGGEERADRSPQEMQQVMQKWVSWLQGLAEQGHLKDRGQPLER